MTAFVIGNGTSRRGLDLHSLRPAGKIYGCNALYRDFAPDFLFSTDPGIAKEIELSGYPENNVFYTRKPSHCNSKTIELNYGYSSGPIAISYAAEHGNKNIYLIGFDLQGIGNKHNNMYSDTENYKDSGSSATFYGNWVNQVFEISRKFHSTEFYRIDDGNTVRPDQWQHQTNIKFQTIDEFVSEVNTVSWQKQKK